MSQPTYWDIESLNAAKADAAISGINDQVAKFAEKYTTPKEPSQPSPPPFSLSSLLPSLTPWAQPKEPTATDTAAPTAPTAPQSTSLLDMLPSLTPWAPKPSAGVATALATPPVALSGPVAPSVPGQTPAAMPSGPAPSGPAPSGPAPQYDPSAGVEQWNPLVQEAATAYGVDPADLKGLMHIESGGNPKATSSAGAASLMQVMPFHFQPGEDPYDPRTNIMRGAKVYADALRRYGGDKNKAAAAYFGAIDSQGNITGASDGNTDGYGYVRQFNDARARYQGAPNAGAAQPAAPAAVSSRAAAGAPSGAPSGGSGPITVRDQWGNTWQTTQEQLNRRPGGYKDLTILPPQANAQPQPDALRTALSAPAGDTMARQPLGAATMGPDTGTGDSGYTVASGGDGALTAGSVPSGDREAANSPMPAATNQSVTATPSAYGASGDEQQTPAYQPPQYDYSYSQGDQQFPAADYQPVPVRATPANTDVQMAQGGPIPGDDPSQYIEMPTRPRGAAPAAYGASGDDPGQPPYQPPVARAEAQISQQGMPEIPFKEGFTPILDAGHKVIAWLQNTAQDVGSTVANEGIVRPIARPISNAIRTATGRAPLTPEEEAARTPTSVSAIDTAVSQTARSLGADVGALQQGYEQGNVGQAAMGALGLVGDLAPSTTIARQLNEMVPKVPTPLGEIGAGDVVMTAALASDAVRLGYGVIKAGGRTLQAIARAVQEGVPAEQFGDWLSSGVTGAGAARVAEDAAVPAAARVAEEAPAAAQPSFRDFSRSLETPANENGQLAILPTKPRPTNDQLIREEYGRPWEELPRSPATQEMASEANGVIPRPRDRVNPADIENTLPTDSYTPNMSGRMNVSPGISRSAGLIGDAANALGGGVGGATIGAGLPADSDEERRQHALIGAGAGMLAGPAVGRLLPQTEGALATFGASPNYKPPTPAALKAAEVQGARRGEMLNRTVTPPGTTVPGTVRAATAATDDRAGMRWAENILSDAAGSPRMRENDPARPATQTRINAGGVAEHRIKNGLDPAVMDAGAAGLQNELPRYLEDMHHRDVLDEFYNRGHSAVMEQRQPAIDAAKVRGANPVVIQRMEAKAAADADQAGQVSMRKRQGSNPEHTYEATDARLQEQEQRLTADGRFKQLQDSAQAIWDHNAETRQRLVDSDNLDPQVAADLAAKYPHYVPTVPISHLIEGGGPVASSSTAISRGTKPSVSSLEDVGTSGERLNPIVASRNQTISAERDVQRNNVARAFAQMMDDATAADPAATAVDKATHRTFLGGGVDVHYFENGERRTLSVPKPVADGLEAAANMGVSANGVTSVMKRITGAVTSTLTAARASFVPVNVMRDASDYATRTMAREGNNPAKLPAILGTWADEAGKAALDILAANRNGRTAIGAATGFGAGALQGDDQTPLSTRLVHGVEGAAAGALLLGANKVQTTGKAAEYLARGGGSGGAVGSLKAGQRWYRDVLRDGGAPLKSPGEALRALGDWAHDVASLQGVKGVNERMETVSRTAAMRRAEAQGANPIESMIAGRDASVDFDRAGTVTRAWNGFIPFLNATVQGGAQFGRMFKNQTPAGRAATVGAIGATLGPVMLATEYWNRSDSARAQAYDDVPQYVKDSGIVLMMPNAGSDNRGSKPNYLWLPTEALSPFVVGMRAAMQHADSVVPGVSPSAGRSDAAASVPWAPDVLQQPLGALNEALSVFYPVKGDSAMSIASTAVPPLVKQAIELGQNKDLFRGGTISSPSQDERASGLGHTVAGAANAAGRTLGNQTLQNITPSQVDYLTRQLPAYGDIASGVSDMVKPSPYKVAEQGRLANEPFVGGVASRFVRDAGGANLERSQGAAMTPSVQAALAAARMHPSDVDLTVPADYKNAPLKRNEQLRWQKAFDSTINQEIAMAKSTPEWAIPATRAQALKTAVTNARDMAATTALATISDGEIQQRIATAERMKRKAMAQ